MQAPAKTPHFSDSGAGFKEQGGIGLPYFPHTSCYKGPIQTESSSEKNPQNKSEKLCLPAAFHVRTLQSVKNPPEFQLIWLKLPVILLCLENQSSYSLDISENQIEGNRNNKANRFAYVNKTLTVNCEKLGLRILEQEGPTEFVSQVRSVQQSLNWSLDFLISLVRHNWTQVSLRLAGTRVILSPLGHVNCPNKTSLVGAEDISH